MKIGISVLTTPLDRLGGLSLRLANLIKGLAEAGHEVFVIQTKEALDESLGFYRSVAGLPVKPMGVDFPLGKGFFFWPSLVALWCFPIDKIIPDEIDVLDLRDPLVNVPKSRDYRVVFGHNHFTPYILQHLRNCGFRSMVWFPEIPFLQRVLREAGKRIDGYIVQTEKQRAWLVRKRRIQKELVTAIPPGFDADLIQSARRFTTENTRPTILFSGRLHRWKGVYELLKAFSWLAHDYPQWNLHFVGDGPARSELQKEAQARRLQERVVFWGKKTHDQALKIVAGATIFVLPSYIETFGTSLLEAMVLGIPSIATDVGGVRDYMIEDGMTGLIVPLKDSKALYHALVRLVSDRELRLSLGENGRERVKELTLDKMVHSTIEFYKWVVSA